MSVVVLMYSKYSSACDRLLQMMNPVLDFRKICIDHDAVRQLVVSDPKRFQIRTVPCILVFFANGGMNKFEGEDAFRWARETIQKMKNIVRETVETPSPGATPASPNVVSHMERGFSTFPSSHQVRLETFSSIPVVAEQHDPSIVEGGNRQLTEAKAVMPIDTEVYTDMKRRMDTNPLFPPRETIPARGNTTQSSSTQESPEETEGESAPSDHPSKAIKKDKQENLMTLAQQMQKQRDREDEIINPNPVSKITETRSN